MLNEVVACIVILLIEMWTQGAWSVVEQTNGKALTRTLDLLKGRCWTEVAGLPYLGSIIVTAKFYCYDH